MASHVALPTDSPTRNWSLVRSKSKTHFGSFYIKAFHQGGQEMRDVAQCSTVHPPPSLYLLMQPTI